MWSDIQEGKQYEPDLKKRNDLKKKEAHRIMSWAR